MTLSVAQVTFDGDNPRELADWWAQAIGSSMTNDWGEFVTVDGAPVGLRGLGFGRVPEGKVAKNRAHIDFHADDRASEVSRLVGLGATKVAEHEVPGLQWTVLLDPAGNEFCVSG